MRSLPQRNAYPALIQSLPAELRFGYNQPVMYHPIHCERAFLHLPPYAFHGSALFSFRFRFQSLHMHIVRLEDKAGKSDSSADYQDKNSSCGQIYIPA